MFSRWGLRASTAWNISGEPCSGAAVDDTDIDSDNKLKLGIKCVCSYNVSTVCHITQLKVYALDVVGQIPAELQNLTYLTNLNLAQNYLAGSLPAFLGKLTRLQYLAISTNKFVGPLPEVVENLSNLEQLYIDSCGLSGELPSTFSKLKNLKVLRIGDLTGEVSSLAFVANMTSLSTLVLRNSRISDNLASVDFSKFLTSIIWT
ncbi:unnamed protein product [Triticum turgidum subsp. durum]|uniref:Disease resistance R13L4/SHOC-2-like LRR domain-containing protein n=1 Tax=Triticum turgidum subsp. durum TaxID=4567 RepID=A0A9R1QU10_TRITD|nr:unnamed protein product [Triticum turgidum subsp. durum]